MRSNLAAGLILVLLMAGISFSINVSSCQVLSSPGVYDLNASLSGAPNNFFSQYIYTWRACIVINSSDVLLDCHGYNITNSGLGAASGIGVSAGSGQLNNITVQNCGQISGNYFSGIAIANVDNSSFINTNISGCQNGFHVMHSNNLNISGIQAVDGSNSTLPGSTDNVFSGFRVENATGVQISGSTIRNVSSYGMVVYTGINLNIHDNSISYARPRFFGMGQGVLLFSVNHSAFSRNNVSYNQAHGLQLADGIINENGGYYVNITDNVFIGNAYSNIFAVKSYGCRFSGNNLSNCTIANEGIGGRYGSGMWIQNGNSETSVANNTVFGNRFGANLYLQNAVVDGIYAYNNTRDGIWLIGDNSTIKNSRAFNNNGTGIYQFSNRNNMTNNTAAYNGQHGFYFGYPYTISINNTAYNNNWSGFYYYLPRYPISINDYAYNNSQYGFYFVDIGNGDFRNTNSQDNALGGIYLDRMSGSSSFNNATLLSNGGPGAYVNQSNYITFSNSSFNGNTFGIYSFYASWIMPSDSVFDNNGIGFYDLGGSYHTFSNVSFQNNPAGILANGTTQLSSSDSDYEGSDAAASIIGGSYGSFTSDLFHDSGTGLRASGTNFLSTASSNFSGNGVALSLANSGSTHTLPRIENNTLGVNVSNAGTNTFNNALFLANGLDLYTEAPSSSPTLILNNAVFGDPLLNHTNLSINDVVDASTAYLVNFTTEPAPIPNETASFNQKFVEIASITGAPVLDTLVYLWDDSEIPVNQTEEDITLFQYDGAWAELDGDLDTGANTLTATGIAPASSYGLLFLPPAPSGPTEDGGNKLHIEKSFGGFVFDEAKFNVTSGSAKIPDAKIYITYNSIVIETLNTDSKGSATFTPGEPGKYYAQAKKSGYTDSSSIPFTAGLNPLEGRAPSSIEEGESFLVTITSSGEPVADATVMVCQTRKTTDSQGIAAFSISAAGLCQITAGKGGYQNWSSSVSILPAEPKPPSEEEGEAPEVVPQPEPEEEPEPERPVSPLVQVEVPSVESPMQPVSESQVESSQQYLWGMLVLVLVIIAAVYYFRKKHPKKLKK